MQQNLEWLASRISHYKACSLAVFLVEAHRPLRGVAETLLTSFGFIAKPILGEQCNAALQALFSSPENIDNFLARLEELSHSAESGT